MRLFVACKVPYIAFHLVKLCFSELPTPGDLAVLVIRVNLRDSDGLRFPVDIGDDHGMLIVDQADMIADAQIIKVAEFRDRCIRSENKITEQGSIAEALGQITEIRKGFRHSAAVHITIGIAVGIVGSAGVRYAHGSFHPGHPAGIHADVVPV